MTTAYFYGIRWLTPIVFTALMALLTSIISQLSYAFFTNKEFIKNGTEEMKKLQKELLAMQPSEPAYLEKQNKMLDLNMALMTHTMKPSMITMIPFLLIFFYAKSIVTMDEPIILLPFSVPLVGSSIEFIGTYILFNLLFTTLVRQIIRR